MARPAEKRFGNRAGAPDAAPKRAKLARPAKSPRLGSKRVAAMWTRVNGVTFASFTTIALSSEFTDVICNGASDRASRLRDLPRYHPLEALPPLTLMAISRS